MPRPLLSLLLALVVCAAAGCADGAEPRAAVADRPTAYVSPSEVERHL